MELNSEEIELIKSAQDGAVAAFEELVRRFEGFVFALASKHGPKEDVESIVQDTFLSAFRSLSSLRDPAAFPAWLHGIAIRRCRDFWRTHYRRTKYEMNLGGLAEETLQKLSQIPEESPQEERAELVEALLRTLSPDDRMIMTLLYLEDRPVRQVAELLDLSQVNVKVRAHRIRKKLEKQLTEIEAS